MSHFVLPLHILLEEISWQGPLRPRPKEELVEILCPEFSHASNERRGGVIWWPPSLSRSLTAYRGVAGVTAPRTHSFGLNTSRREEREAGANFPKTTDRGGTTRGEMLSATLRLSRDGSLIVDVEPELSLLMDWHNEYQVGRK